MTSSRVPCYTKGMNSQDYIYGVVIFFFAVLIGVGFIWIVKSEKAKQNRAIDINCVNALQTADPDATFTVNDLRAARDFCITKES